MPETLLYCVRLLLFVLFLCQLLEMTQEAEVSTLDKEIHSPPVDQQSTEAELELCYKRRS